MQDDDDDMVFTVPERHNRFSIDIEMVPTIGIDRIEALNTENGRSSSNKKNHLRKLRGFALEVQRWEYIMSGEVCLLKANRFWVVAACFDGTVLVLSTSTGFLSFTFKLDSAPCSLSLENSYLSVITGYGFIYVWDLEEGKVLLPKRSCLDPFSQDDSLEKHMVTNAGIPVLHLSSGKTFAFASGCWQLLGDKNNVLTQFSNPVPEPSELLGTNLLYLLCSPNSGALHIDGTTKMSATCSLLEERLNAANVFQCEDDFRVLLDYYVHWLLKTRDMEKLDSLIFQLKRQKVWFGSLNANEALGIIERIKKQYLIAS